MIAGWHGNPDAGGVAKWVQASSRAGRAFRAARDGKIKKMQDGKRRAAALEPVERAGAEALLVTHGQDVRWLTGFTGSSGAVALARGKVALFTDGRYTSQAKAE